jgi:hypothetical protein
MLEKFRMSVYVIIASVTFPFMTMTAYAGGETKEVCNDKTDAKGQVVKGKDGKPVQVCKKIKVHQKLEGTVVPDKK